MATLRELFHRMFNLTLPWKRSALPLIQGLRDTGHFNNDWDTTYAVCLYVVCFLPDSLASRFLLGRSERTRRPERLQEAEAARTFVKARRLVGGLARSLRCYKNESTAEAVWKSLPREKLELCERVKEYLSYPGNPPSSTLASIFDEIYHGGTLYREMYDAEPLYRRESGLIEQDRVIVSSSDLRYLSRLSQGRLAIVTGRPRRATEYSLGKLMSYFQQDASVFIGDGDIHPTPDAASFRKPGGKSLLWSRERLHSEKLLYVGDSAEDLQMVANAKKEADGLAFAGVYANSYEPRERLRFFKARGAELILPSVRAMTSVMKEVSVA